jgi:hypothetical protein
MAVIQGTIQTQNSLITPAASPVGRTPTAADQQWLFSLGGVARPGLQGRGTDWTRATYEFSPNLGRASAIVGPLQRDHLREFWVQQWSMNVSLNTVHGRSPNSGFSVDDYRVVTLSRGGGPFRGFQADIAVLDSAAVLVSIGYSILLLVRVVDSPNLAF